MVWGPQCVTQKWLIGYLGQNPSYCRDKKKSGRWGATGVVRARTREGEVAQMQRWSAQVPSYHPNFTRDHKHQGLLPASKGYGPCTGEFPTNPVGHQGCRSRRPHMGSAELDAAPQEHTFWISSGSACLGTWRFMTRSPGSCGRRQESVPAHWSQRPSPGGGGLSHRQKGTVHAWPLHCTPAAQPETSLATATSCGLSPASQMVPQT